VIAFFFYYDQKLVVTYKTRLYQKLFLWFQL
jgi:hypothetical protein